jgi:hypothetical protein
VQLVDFWNTDYKVFLLPKRVRTVRSCEKMSITLVPSSEDVGFTAREGLIHSIAIWDSHPVNRLSVSQDGFECTHSTVLVTLYKQQYRI